MAHNVTKDSYRLMRAGLRASRSACFPGSGAFSTPPTDTGRRVHYRSMGKGTPARE